jgi:hypothetical protein
MRVLAIDPGAKPGFAVFQDGRLSVVTYDPDDIDALYEMDPAELNSFDEVVLEDQHPATHVTRNGRRSRISRGSQQSLSFSAGRLFERFDADRKYRIPVADWRRLKWPPGAALVKVCQHPLPKWTKAIRENRTKYAVLSRLWLEYGDWVVDFPSTHQPDVLEAIGINQAWALLPASDKQKYLYV